MFPYIFCCDEYVLLFLLGGLQELNITTCFLMKSWEDVGGCDLWVHAPSMEVEHYWVFHCTLPKHEWWKAGARWSYSGCFDWMTYGQKGFTPKDKMDKKNMENMNAMKAMKAMKGIKNPKAMKDTPKGAATKKRKAR